MRRPRRVAPSRANGQEAQRRYYRLTERGWTSLRKRLRAFGQLDRRRAREPAPAEGPRVTRLATLLLVWLYPAAFRERYGDEIVEAIALERDARRKSRVTARVRPRSPSSSTGPARALPSCCAAVSSRARCRARGSVAARRGHRNHRRGPRWTRSFRISATRSGSSFVVRGSPRSRSSRSGSRSAATA